LTACLVVLGRYIPHLEFFNVVFGDAPVLPPEARFYQRLLAMDYSEAREVADAYGKEHSLVEVYDSVLIPALSLAERDRHRNTLDKGIEEFVCQSIKELMEELADARKNEHAADGNSPSLAGPPGIGVLCLPARDEADEITGAMLVQLLELAGHRAQALALGTGMGDVAELIAHQQNVIVCVSALPPFAVMTARSMCTKLRARFPNLEIIAGLWTPSDGSGKTEERVRTVFASRVPVTVATTLKEALDRITALADSLPRGEQEAIPVPAGEN
jgi:hypothetical protein